MLGEAVIDTIAPSKLGRDWNANSLVLKVTYGETSFLLMGDANTTTEKELINSKADLQANVLKLGHHGAGDATSEEFLKKVLPQYAVISVDVNNNRGHPAAFVIKRLENNDVKILITHRNGNISFLSDGKVITLLD